MPATRSRAASKKKSSTKKRSTKKSSTKERTTRKTSRRTSTQSQSTTAKIVSDDTPNEQASSPLTVFLLVFATVFGFLVGFAKYHDVQTTPALNASLVFSLFGAWITFSLIPSIAPMFVKANLFGVDMSKVKIPGVVTKVPEAMGVISGGVYLVAMFLFIPFPFLSFFGYDEEDVPHTEFPHKKYSEFVAGLLSVCTMILLGFADDVLNLKWRHKLYLPTIATLPLLMVYYVNMGSTSVVVPLQLRGVIGSDVLDLGYVYFVYMGMVAVFCTNAINILAGINGVEVGQSVVIAVSIVCHNIIQLGSEDTSTAAHNLFSLYMLLPFIGTSLALAYHNFYPSRVFVGDTYCYFAGMTFAVVGILGHFSKTTMLFFVPQTVNFLYSVPQLFKFIPIPRHRLPAFNPETGLMDMSRVTFSVPELNAVGRVCFRVLRFTRLIDVRVVDEQFETVSINNLTIINFMLKLTGPVNEGTLTTIMLTLQVICSVLAFLLRYEAAKLFFARVQ